MNFDIKDVMKFSIEDVMKFDIKDIKSWSNRKDVKIGDKGYFFNKISNLHDLKENEYSKIESINDNQANCFFSTAFYGGYSFFLPLNAVKKDEPKIKYRPFKSMAEFTKVVYNLVPDNLNITGVGESFMVRRKCNQHIEKVLITHLEYDANHNLISINGQSLKSLFENYEIITDDCKIIPFGVDVKKND